MNKFHPMQEITIADGVARFRANEIVRYILEKGPFDMNHLAGRDFTQADKMQFAQLIGYSVAGFGELSYAANRVVREADEIAEGLFNPHAVLGIHAEFEMEFQKMQGAVLTDFRKYKTGSYINTAVFWAYRGWCCSKGVKP